VLCYRAYISCSAAWHSVCRYCARRARASSLRSSSSWCVVCVRVHTCTHISTLHARQMCLIPAMILNGALSVVRERDLLGGRVTLMSVNLHQGWKRPPVDAGHNNLAYFYQQVECACPV
jgi:hypothetical protein